MSAFSWMWGRRFFFVCSRLTSGVLLFDAALSTEGGEAVSLSCSCGSTDLQRFFYTGVGGGCHGEAPCDRGTALNLPAPNPSPNERLWVSTEHMSCVRAAA